MTTQKLIVTGKRVTPDRTEAQEPEDRSAASAAQGASHVGHPERQTLPKSLLHDLRIPLNQIIGFSELLAEQAADEGLPGFLPDIEMIRAAGHNLLHLITTNFQSEDPSPRHKASERATPPAVRPIRQADDPTTAKSSRPAKASLTGVILVVDDNEMNRAVLSQRLTKQGHEVILAYDGQEALAALHTQTLDLVLLDIMMPKIDGFSVLEQMKASPALRHIPVLVVSALSEPEGVLRCIEMGVDDYLVKPIDSHRLKARVGACLEKKFVHDNEMKVVDDLRRRCLILEEAARAELLRQP